MIWAHFCFHDWFATSRVSLFIVHPLRLAFNRQARNKLFWKDSFEQLPQTSPEKPKPGPWRVFGPSFEKFDCGQFPAQNLFKITHTLFPSTRLIDQDANKVWYGTFNCDFKYTRVLHEIWAEARKLKQNHGNWSKQLRLWLYCGFLSTNVCTLS
jgi:hypothetical protein